MREYADAMKEYDRQLELFGAAQAGRRRSGHEQDDQPPTPPAQPICKRYFVSDITMEAVGPLLVENPRGFLVDCEELAGWIGSFDRYMAGKKGSDAQFWLKVHGARDIVQDRKTGVRTIYVPRAAVSITGGVQPSALRRSLGKENFENGLAARLLMAMPPRQTKKWTDTDIDPKMERKLATIIERLNELVPGTDENDQPCPIDVPLTDAAKRVWVKFYNTHGKLQAETTGNLAAAFSKLEGYAARFALILRFARWSEQLLKRRPPTKIDEEAMRAGITLARWFVQETERVYAILIEDDEDHDMRELAEWIVGKGGRVTSRELQRGPQQYRKSQEDAERALNALVEAEQGQWIDVPSGAKGGKPTREFELFTDGDGDTTS